MNSAPGPGYKDLIERETRERRYMLFMSTPAPKLHDDDGNDAG